MLEHLKNLRMTSQGLLIQISIAIVVLLILFIAQLIIISIVIQSIDTSSQQILLKINDNSINALSGKLKNSFDEQFNQIFINLNTTQKLYTKSQELELKQEKIYCPPFNFNYSFLPNYSLIYHCFFIQKQQNLSYDGQYYNLLNLVALYDQWFLAINTFAAQGSHLFMSTQSPHFFASFPVTFYTSTFDVEVRPYYIQQLSQKNDINIASVYQSFSSNFLQLQITRVLYNKKNQIDSIVGIGQGFQNIANFLRIQSSKIVFCQKDGVLIASNLENTKVIQTQGTISYIQNRTDFYFDSVDWLELNNYLDGKQFVSNCQIGYKFFCRNINGQDIQIQALRIQKVFILIIFNDLNFEQQQKDRQQEFIQDVILNYLYYSSYISVTLVVILLVSFIVMKQIMRPTTQIITTVVNYLKNSINQSRIKTNTAQLGIITNLMKSYDNFLNQHIENKKRIISLMNSFSYPRAYLELEQSNLQDLYNFYYDFYDEQFEEFLKIIQELKGRISISTTQY
ncbi:hypothetical protein pb186bvf_007553 [Paramecium bursaria]